MRQTETALGELIARDLSGEDITVLMLDGEHMAERCMVAALAFTADGTKLPLGLWDGSTENKTVVRGCCPDLVDRDLKFDDGLLVVLDGAKALAAAGREVSGAKALIQRCTLQHRRPATRRNRASPNPTMLLPAVGLPQSAPSVNFRFAP